MNDATHSVSLESMKCPRCGSTKMIPDCPIRDTGQHSAGRLNTIVALGDPDALLFDEPILAELRASICCSCGYVEITVNNPEELWKAYQQAPDQPPLK